MQNLRNCGRIHRRPSGKNRPCFLLRGTSHPTPHSVAFRFVKQVTQHHSQLRSASWKKTPSTTVSCVPLRGRRHPARTVQQSEPVKQALPYKCGLPQSRNPPAFCNRLCPPTHPAPSNVVGHDPAHHPRSVTGSAHPPTRRIRSPDAIIPQPTPVLYRVCPSPPIAPLRATLPQPAPLSFFHRRDTDANHSDHPQPQRGGRTAAKGRACKERRPALCYRRHAPPVAAAGTVAAPPVLSAGGALRPGGCGGLRLGVVSVSRVCVSAVEKWRRQLAGPLARRSVPVCPVIPVCPGVSDWRPDWVSSSERRALRRRAVAFRFARERAEALWFLARCLGAALVGPALLLAAWLLG